MFLAYLKNIFYPKGTFFLIFKVKKQYFRQRLLDLKPQDTTLFVYKVF